MENQIKAGDPIILDDTPIYTTETATRRSSVKTGTFYYWDDSIINNKIRITDSVEHIGNEEYITGWVSVNTIEQDNKAVVDKDKEDVKLKSGDIVKFKSTAQYWSNKQILPTWVKDGVFIIKTVSGEYASLSSTKSLKLIGTAFIKDLYKI